MSERLWAPWRLKYIQAAAGPEGGTGCIFCDLPRLPDEQAHIVHRGERAFVILNAYPYTSGHLMVAPNLHTAELADLDADTHAEIGILISRAVGWLKEVYSPDGFNIGTNLGHAAGAGVPGHLHWHIVPRWAGDTNFMGSIGEVRVLPQSLEESWTAICTAVARQK